jgi:hypothetical protein
LPTVRIEPAALGARQREKGGEILLLFSSVTHSKVRNRTNETKQIQAILLGFAWR